MDATPSVALPADATPGVPRRPPQALTLRGREFEWGSRTFVMGIVNVTPDSFSGDGLLTTGADPVAAAVAQARQMAADGADVLDIGGVSTRPGHDDVAELDELRRVEPVVRAVREALPDMPLSIDSTRAAVVEAALDAGADAINDVWGVRRSDGLARIAAERGVPLVLMHNREAARYQNVIAEVLADLQGAIDRALAVGVRWEQIIVDPGIGFGKTAEHNLAVLQDLHTLAMLGRPVLLGTSRKSTIGKVLDLPAGERLEGTLATTALGIQSGVDIIRVHDVMPNVRVARMADAIVRGEWHERATQTGGPR